LVFRPRKRHERAAAGLLDDLDASVLQILRGVRELVLNDVLTDTEKVAKIGALVEPEQIAETKSRALRASLVNDAVDCHYFDILETRRASPRLPFINARSARRRSIASAAPSYREASRLSRSSSRSECHSTISSAR
jgi:hypothetical protein